MSHPIDLREFPRVALDQLVIPSQYKDELDSVLAPEGFIQARVDRMAQEINEWEYDPSKSVLAVCMLNGAAMFYNDLTRKLTHGIEPSYLRAKSYEGESSTGSVDFFGYDFSKAQDRDVVIFEDIIDSGLTMLETKREFNKHNPRSLRVVSLIDKPEGRDKEFDINPDLAGLIVPNVFIVGYGLDYNDRYRDLPHLAVKKT